MIICFRKKRHLAPERRVFLRDSNSKEKGNEYGYMSINIYIYDKFVCNIYIWTCLYAYVCKEKTYAYEYCVPLGFEFKRKQ